MALKGNIMATEKLFTVAGYATNPNGTVKVRFANDLVARIKILNKAGCTDINLVELPRAMNKVDALEYLASQGVSGDAAEVVATKLADKQAAANRSNKSVTLKTGGNVKVGSKSKAKATA